MKQPLDAKIKFKHEGKSYTFVSGNNHLTGDQRIEQEAWAIAADRKLLLKRLDRAKSCLVKSLQKKFDVAHFDFENKRLESKCGKYRLQW